MPGSENMQKYAHFANLLDYPAAELIARAGVCAHTLEQDLPQAAGKIRDFIAFAGNVPPGRMEEIYTATFDINPTCYIFAGYMLFGESFNRAKFLVRLQEEYARRGFSMEGELADHLAVMFRFFSTLDPNETLAQELREDCFYPVVKKMLSNFTEDSGGEQNPYRLLLGAILMALESNMIFEQAAVPAEVMHNPASEAFLKSTRRARQKEVPS